MESQQLLKEILENRISSSPDFLELFYTRTMLLTNTHYLKLALEYNKFSGHIRKKFQSDRKKILNLLNRIKNVNTSNFNEVSLKQHIERVEIAENEMENLNYKFDCSKSFNDLNNFVKENGIITPEQILSRIGKDGSQSGLIYEDKCEEILKNKGWIILEKNYQLSKLPGEIDLVVQEPSNTDIIYILEVKKTTTDVKYMEKKIKQVESFINEYKVIHPSKSFRLGYVFQGSFSNDLQVLSSQLNGKYMHRLALSLDPNLRIGNDGKISFPKGKNLNKIWISLFKEFEDEYNQYKEIRGMFDDGVVIDDEVHLFKYTGIL